MPCFREALAGLPALMQRQARAVYRLFANHPTHRETAMQASPRYATDLFGRVRLNYRALGVREGEDLVWCWIGSHAEYDRLVASL